MRKDLSVSMVLTLLGWEWSVKSGRKVLAWMEGLPNICTFISMHCLCSSVASSQSLMATEKRLSGEISSSCAVGKRLVPLFTLYLMTMLLRSSARNRNLRMIVISCIMSTTSSSGSLCTSARREGRQHCDSWMIDI